MYSIYWCFFYLDEKDTHSHQEVHTRTMWLPSVYRKSEAAPLPTLEFYDLIPHCRNT